MAEELVDTGLLDADIQGVAQPGRAAGPEPAGRRFEACHPDHPVVQETSNLLSVPEQITVAVNPPPGPLPAGFTAQTLAALAREVVMNIRDLSEILIIYKLTPAQYDYLKEQSYFKNVVDAFSIEWHSPLSTEKRIKIGSLAILENNMTHLGARMTKNDEPFPPQVEAAKLFAKMGGIGEQGPSAGAGGEKFTININLGEDTKIQYIKDVTPAKAMEGSAETVPPNPQER